MKMTPRPAKRLVSALCVCASVCCVAAAATNLVVNGDCENGGSVLPLAPAVGWSGAFVCCGNAAVCGAPLNTTNGTRVFFAGDCSGPSCVTRANLYVQEAWQDVDVSGVDPSTQSLVLAVAERSQCGFDAAHARFELRAGAGGAVLATTQTCSYRGGTWARFVAVMVPPAGTLSVRVRLQTTASFGAVARGVHDGVSVSVCTTGER